MPTREAEALAKLSPIERLKKLRWVRYVTLLAVVLIAVSVLEFVQATIYERCMSREADSIFSELKKKFSGPDQETKEFLLALRNEFRSRCGHEDLIHYYLNRSITSLRTVAPAIAADPSAQAQPKSTPGPNVSADGFSIGKYTESDVRGIILIIIFLCIVICFISSILAILFSKNENVISFGMDSIKTLLGFLAGIATAILGVHR